jgi:hypothetical protein
MPLFPECFAIQAPLGKLGLGFVCWGANGVRNDRNKVKQSGHKGTSLFAPVRDMPTRAPSLIPRTINRVDFHAIEAEGDTPVHQSPLRAAYISFAGLF